MAYRTQAEGIRALNRRFWGKELIFCGTTILAGIASGPLIALAMTRMHALGLATDLYLLTLGFSGLNKPEILLEVPPLTYLLHPIALESVLITSVLALGVGSYLGSLCNKVHLAGQLKKLYNSSAQPLTSITEKIYYGLLITSAAAPTILSVSSLTSLAIIGLEKTPNFLLAAYGWSQVPYTIAGVVTLCDYFINGRHTKQIQDQREPGTLTQSTEPEVDGTEGLHARRVRADQALQRVEQIYKLHKSFTLTG